jgi:hypothetical protein
MYGINIRENMDFYVLPYKHSKKEARKAISKYLALDTTNIGLFLYKKGNLHGDPHETGNFLIVFYNYLNLTTFKTNKKIHFIDIEGNNIYKNGTLKYDNKIHNINKIMYN